MDALRMVANVSVNDIVEERDALRAELAEAKKALDAVKAKAAMHTDKYCDLVWIARKNREEALHNTSHPSHGGVVEVINKYPDEVLTLSGPHGNFSHGFNSGILAASRMYFDLSASCEEDLDEELEDDLEDGQPLLARLDAHRQQAVEDFPCLDT